MKGSSSMNSTEVFLLQELQLFIDADSTGLPGRFTGRCTHGPGIPGIHPKMHNISDMRSILCSSSQIGSSILVLFSCKICHFWKGTYYYWLHERERGKRYCSFIDNWLIPSLKMDVYLLAISTWAVWDAASSIWRNKPLLSVTPAVPHHCQESISNLTPNPLPPYKCVSLLKHNPCSSFLLTVQPASHLMPSLPLFWFCDHFYQPAGCCFTTQSKLKSLALPFSCKMYLQEKASRVLC